MDRPHALEKLEARLTRIARSRSQRPAPQVLVQAPGLDFRFGDLAQPFHAASAGKLMTAALIVSLIERGALSFDTPLGATLPSDALRALPAAPGVDVARDVSVEHLLTQTSGLPCFFEPPRGHRTASSIASVAHEADRRWTPAGLLDEARRLPAVGRPGERFAYSDTNYVLLGRIAEEAGGDSLAGLLRTRIFEPAGMERSSTPYDATLIPDDLGSLDVAPFWIGRHELSRAHAISLDWGGGNVVAPADDFLRFQRALHGGQLIAPENLARLTRPRNRFRRGIHYGAGTMTLRFGELMPPFLRGLPQPVGHLGVWATHLFHYPRQQAFVALNFHATREMNRSFMVHAQIARILADLGDVSAVRK